MDHPYLRARLASIAGQWNRDQLHEAFMSLVHNTATEDLEEYFEAELEEDGYDFIDHE